MAFELNLFKKLFGEKMVDEALKEFNDIKNEWNARHQKHFEDHRKIAELLGEIIKRLDEIEKKLK